MQTMKAHTSSLLQDRNRNLLQTQSLNYVILLVAILLRSPDIRKQLLCGGIVHPDMNILASYIHSHVAPKHFLFFFFLNTKGDVRQVQAVVF